MGHEMGKSGLRVSYNRCSLSCMTQYVLYIAQTGGKHSAASYGVFINDQRSTKIKQNKSLGIQPLRRQGDIIIFCKIRKGAHDETGKSDISPTTTCIGHRRQSPDGARHHHTHTLHTRKSTYRMADERSRGGRRARAALRYLPYDVQSVATQI